MPVCRLGSGGKSSKFKMALSKKQLLLLHVVIAKSTKTTYQIFKTVLGKTNIPNESTNFYTIVKTVKELQEEDHEGYFNYFRINPNQFAGLFTQFGKATNLEVQ